MMIELRQKGDFMERIVVRTANWIGDAVMSLPALEALKRLFPGAEISVLVKPHIAPIFEDNPAVSEIVIYDSLGAHNGLNGRMRLAGELRARDFDCAVLFQNAFEAALIAFLAKIPRRVGYARDLRSVFLTDPIEVTAEIKKQHQAQYYLNIIRTFGAVEVDNPLPVIRITGDDEQRASELLSSLALAEGTPIIGASPGASYGPAKRWAPKNFAFVLEEFSKRSGAVPLIFGSKDDVEFAEELSKGLGVKHHNLVGKTDLREFMALTRRLELFITNDSGPMHIAAALGTPTLAIFGSTSDVLTGPLGPKVEVVREEIACAPCFERVCPDGHYECLTSVDPERVLNVALSFVDADKKKVFS